MFQVKLVQPAVSGNPTTPK